MQRLHSVSPYIEKMRACGKLHCNLRMFFSLSADASKKGRPTNFRVNVRDVRPAAGAGFLIAYLGEIRTMPGLPSEPAAMHVDIDERGNVMGLF